MGGFNEEEEKKKSNEENFPKDLKKAYELGVKLSK